MFQQSAPHSPGQFLCGCPTLFSASVWRLTADHWAWKPPVALLATACYGQAPHVILVGEVRDKEVSLIAVQAANTGHLVLTTLHTNSALGNISPAGAWHRDRPDRRRCRGLVMAQRLLPQLCPVCRKSRRSTEAEKARIQKLAGVTLQDHIYHVNMAGCRNCYKGYVGRRILSEVIPVDATIRDLLLHSKSVIPSDQIAKHAADHFNYKPLLTQAIEVVNEGQADLKDAQRLLLDFGD